MLWAKFNDNEGRIQSVTVEMGRWAGRGGGGGGGQGSRVVGVSILASGQSGR